MSIDGGMGHMGVSSGTTAKGIASGVGNFAITAGSVAAGAFGGPLAGAAVSSLRGVLPGAGGAGGASSGSGSAVDQGAQLATNASDNAKQGTVDQLAQSKVDQMDLFRLQQAASSMNESFSTLSNIAKQKHDNNMAAINNTR